MNTSVQTPDPAPIVVRADGSIAGIDGMLDQIGGALARQFRTELWPVIRADQALQQHVGRAVGRELAKPLWVLAGVVGLYVGWKVYKGR
jgi:hypothetical protein